MYCLREYDQMKGVYERFNALYRGMCNAINEVEDHFRGMKIPWEGEANRMYLLRMEADFLEIERVMARIYKAKDFLREAIEGYQKTENLIEQRIGGLSI